MTEWHKSYNTCDVSHDAHSRTQRVSRQVCERQVFDIDYLQRPRICAGLDRLLFRLLPRATDCFFPRQILKNLVNLTAHLCDRGAHRVGDRAVFDLDHFRDPRESGRV